MMIADGKATLNFIVEAYRTVHLSSGKDSLEFVDYRLLPPGSLKIVEERSGATVGMTYNTTTIPFDTVKFHAEIGTVKSRTKAVALRAKPVEPPKIYVDVIFHVWELNTTHVTYYVSSYQPVQQAQLEEGLKYMNDIVNNKVGNSPNGASANMEFRLAAKNQAGQTLPQPGYNRIIYSDNVKANSLALTFNVSDFIAFINANKATTIWNPKQYLNIQVIPSGANNSMGTVYPAKQLAGGGILGVMGTAVNEDDFVKDYANACVVYRGRCSSRVLNGRLKCSVLLARSMDCIRQCCPQPAVIFRFLLRYPQIRWSGSTQQLFLCRQSGHRREKYIADNAMDDSRYPTLLNSITADQVAQVCVP